jgi:hypothetical protein
MKIQRNISKRQFILSVFVSIILFFMSIGLAYPQKMDNDANKLIGTWFGTHKQSDVEGDIQTISTPYSNGAFFIKFRVIQNNRPVLEQNELGTWKLKDNRQITIITTHINGQHLGKDKYITDNYVIRKLTDSEQDCDHVETGTKFKYIRVNDQFKFQQ